MINDLVKELQQNLHSYMFTFISRYIMKNVSMLISGKQTKYLIESIRF